MDHSQAFYRLVLRTLCEAEAPFLIGGAAALAHHTGVTRSVKDVDLMVKRSDWTLIAQILRRAGIPVRIVFPHWLGNAVSCTSLVDIIFDGGNRISPGDED